MTKETRKGLENGEYEVMLVNKNLASKIKRLSRTLHTGPADLLETALHIIEKGFGREIIVREKNSDLRIQALKNIKPQVPLS